MKLGVERMKVVTRLSLDKIIKDRQTRKIELVALIPNDMNHANL